MEKGFIDLMLHEQREERELSKNIECEADENLYEVIQKLKGLVSYNIVNELENHITELLSLYEQRAYEVGIKDGIKLLNEIKAFK